VSATDQLQRERISRQRQAEFEAYQDWERESRLRDELTDAAERIHAPLSNTGEFFLEGDELVNDLGQNLRQVIVDGIENARLMARINPDWHTELERNVIDLEEYDEIAALAKRGEGAIVSYWLIPDAVRYADSSLPGYNRARNKMFTRIAMATKTGVLIRYRSLDGSDEDGVAAMDERLGFTYHHGRGSEQVARDRRHLPAYSGTKEELDLLDQQLCRAYDEALARKHGGEWRYGRPAIDEVDALNFIRGQKDLIAEHMPIVNRIFALTNDPYERNRLMEPHRFNFAAALDDRLHGRTVATLAESGEAARQEGREYDGDCPPADGPTKASDQLEKLGFARKERVRGPCPICRTVVEYDPCDPECSACGATGKNPHRVKKLGRQAAAQAKQDRHKAKAVSPQTERRKLPKGNELVLRTKLAIGGTTSYYEELSTGRTIEP
jgi:hypothetical protein